ncbi:Hypothetical predicted protein [Mytilus galloprovincialis]|uniref:Uncharacterized protein n=2 Tax=Mytilus galloprovincialis TaxID=29158 RepID=A0A8B6GZE3_MYTGA|nr:Hypothetical predicted protein [Mytilus galloprovincialis]
MVLYKSKTILFRHSPSSMKLNLCGVILVLCFVEAFGLVFRSKGRKPTKAPSVTVRPASVESDLGSSGETWEVLPGDEASGLVTPGPSGEETGEVNEDPSVEDSVELFPKPTGAPSSVEDSVELFPKPTGAPSVPVQRFFYSQNSVTRREESITSGSGSDENYYGSDENGSGSDENYYGSDENGSGSEESYTCADPPFYKLLSLFRGFPKTESKEMYGYEAALYDPLLDEFWARKNDLGLDKALALFMMEFSQAIMAEKYQCKGTQLNQMMIDVLKDTTTKFMSEARTYIQDAVGKMKKPVSRHFPWLSERWSKKERASRKPKPSGRSKRAGGKPGPGQGPSKGGKDMMDPKSKKEQFVAKTLALLKKVLREDTASHMETEQFDGIACYLRDVMEYLRGEVEANVPLEQIKVDLATWSMDDYGILFECMDPFFIVMIYEDNWQNVNLPYEENILFQHIGESLKNILQKEGKGDKDRQSIDKVLNKDFPLNLTEVIHKFAMKVLGELKPFLDAKSADQMVDFFRKFLTPEKMKFAEKLIRSLDIFFEGTTSLPDPMTSSAEPVYRRSNWMESEYEIEDEMNRLSKKWSRDGLSKKWTTR